MSRARVTAPILSIAALCGCAAPLENEPGEPATCAAPARASIEWGARAAPPSDGWIELRGAGSASRDASAPPAELASDNAAAIGCSAGLVAESYRLDPLQHTIDLMLKHYGDATLPPAQSAHVSYVLEDEDGRAIEHADLPLTNAAPLAPGSTLHAGGQVGTSRHIERVWARVRL